MGPPSFAIDDARSSLLRLQGSHNWAEVLGRKQNGSSFRWCVYFPWHGGHIAGHQSRSHSEFGSGPPETPNVKA